MNNHQENIKNLNAFFDGISSRISALQDYVRSVSEMVNQKDIQSETTDHRQAISKFPEVVTEKTKDVSDFVNSFDFDALDLSGMEL